MVAKRCAKLAGVGGNNGCTLLTHLKGVDVEQRVHQLSLDGDAARTGTNVPKHAAVTDIHCRQRCQPNGHLGHHLWPTFERLKLGIGNTLTNGACGILLQVQAVGVDKISR